MRHCNANKCQSNLRVLSHAQKGLMEMIILITIWLYLFVNQILHSFWLISCLITLLKESITKWPLLSTSSPMCRTSSYSICATREPMPTLLSCCLPWEPWSSCSIRPQGTTHGWIVFGHCYPSVSQLICFTSSHIVINCPSLAVRSWCSRLWCYGDSGSHTTSTAREGTLLQGRTIDGLTFARISPCWWWSCSTSSSPPTINSIWSTGLALPFTTHPILVCTSQTYCWLACGWHYSRGRWLQMSSNGVSRNRSIGCSNRMEIPLLICRRCTRRVSLLMGSSSSAGIQTSSVRSACGGPCICSVSPALGSIYQASVPCCWTCSS